VPALSTIGAISLGFEKGMPIKYAGIGLLMVAMLARLIFDSSHDLGNGVNQFEAKYFLFYHMIFASIGVLIQKKIVAKNNNTSLLVLCFYIYLVSFSMSCLIYNIKFLNDHTNVSSSAKTNETFTYYFNFNYISTLANVMAIYLVAIIVDAYRYITLMYINKKGHISKVTLYGALHGFYVIIIWLIFEETFFYDYVFISAITIGYAILFFSKYLGGRGAKNKPKNIKFKRAIKVNEHAELLSVSQVKMDGNFFYESSHNRNSIKAVLFNGMESGLLQNSYYGRSNVQNSISRKDAILQYSKHRQLNKFDNLVASMKVSSVRENSDSNNLLSPRSRLMITNAKNNSDIEDLPMFESPPIRLVLKDDQFEHSISS
jgi:hypothetical protein